jgi:hypothetical protein
MAENDSNQVNRREFLRKAAITGAVAWAIPVVQSVAATPAYARHLGTACAHSTPDTLGGSCMGTCKAVCRATPTCGTDNGGPCATFCNANNVCHQGVCCTNACNQGAWTCTNCVVTFAGC